MRRQLIISTLFVLSFAMDGYAQRSTPSRNHLDVGFEFGSIYYVGDLKDNQLPQGRYMNLYPALSVRYRYGHRLSMTLSGMKSQLKGADQWGKSNPGRDFHFRSPITDLSLVGRYELINGRGEDIHSFGLLLGAGHFRFRPEVYNGEWRDAWSLGTEGQHLGGDYPEPYALTGINLKYGLEYSRYLGQNWHLDVHWLHTLTFTDYIDDVSGNYPDPEDISSSAQGEYLGSYTYRYRQGHLPVSGARRGNADQNDGYVQLGVGLRYTLVGQHRHKRSKKDKCKAYN